MKPLLIFSLSISAFTFFGVELNWYSFIVLPILSLSLCLAIVMREHLFVSLSQSHQFVCLFLFSIFVLNLSVHFLNPPYIKPLFEISMAIVLTILVALLILVDLRDNNSSKITQGVYTLAILNRHWLFHGFMISPS